MALAAIIEVYYPLQKLKTTCAWISPGKFRSASTKHCRKEKEIRDRLAPVVPWRQPEAWYLSVRPATIASGPSIQKTGKELWASKLDYNVTAVPITYQGEDGRQC